MTNYARNPLDNTRQRTAEKAYNYMYFIKVVSTAYLPLGWDGTRFLGSSQSSGIYGNGGRSIETNQYSVTSHKRNLQGGTDEAEGHKERLHARGGIPGVFFSYVCWLYSFILLKFNQSTPTIITTTILVHQSYVSVFSLPHLSHEHITYLLLSNIPADTELTGHISNESHQPGGP